MTTQELARAMFIECVESEQSVRRVPDDDQAAALRAELRALARRDGVRIRTARMDDTVVGVRLDAQVWHDDAATMKRKLTLR